MGFFNNFSDEFGKKTGKALGNKLYGRHADDKRVGVRKALSINANGNTDNTQHVDYSKMEEAKRETLKQEQEFKLMETVINIEFDFNDKDSIIKTLTTLCSYVDLWIKESNKNANVAKSKFDAGLAILSTLDTQNPMVNYFMNKKLEWMAYERNKKWRERIITCAVVIFFLLLICIGLNS